MQKILVSPSILSADFANLSKEFRTPLMLIKGPVEQLKNGRVKGDPQNYYDIIYRNTENLHTLSDQLLELTQLEAEAIPVKAREVNLITLLRGIFFSFESIANEKNIAIEFVSDDKSICAWVDRDKLEKIINNILSNAFKFTAEGGIISLAVKKIISGNAASGCCLNGSAGLYYCCRSCFLVKWGKLKGLINTVSKLFVKTNPVND